MNFLNYETVLSPNNFLVSDPDPPVDLQFIVDIPPGSKVKHPDLVNSPLKYTLAMPPAESDVKFLPPPSRMCRIYSSRVTLDVSPSGG